MPLASFQGFEMSSLTSITGPLGCRQQTLLPKTRIYCFPHFPLAARVECRAADRGVIGCLVLFEVLGGLKQNMLRIGTATSTAVQAYRVSTASSYSAFTCAGEEPPYCPGPALSASCPLKTSCLLSLGNFITSHYCINLESFTSSFHRDLLPVLVSYQRSPNCWTSDVRTGSAPHLPAR